MSWQTSSWVAAYSRSTGNARLVFMMLANHMGPQGDNAYPSIETLCREAGGRDHPLAKSTVLRAIDALEALGEILVYENAGKSAGGRKTNRYELPHVDGWAPLDGLIPRATFSSDPLPKSDGDFGSAETDFGSATGGTLVARDGDFGSAQALHKQPNQSNPPQSKKEQPADIGLDAGFEAWWKTYPARDGKTRGDKGKARAAWKRLGEGDRERAVIATPHYAAGTDPQFVMDGVRFLTSRRFDDWQTPGRPRSGPKVGQVNYAGDWAVGDEPPRLDHVRNEEW